MQIPGHPTWAWGAMPMWQAPGTATALPYSASAPGTPGGVPATPVSPAAMAASGYMAVPLMLGPTGQAIAPAGE